MTLAVAGETRVRPGTFVEVDVVTDTRDEALVVPRSALVAEGRRWHVFKVDSDGERVRMLDIEPGFEEGDRVEIASVHTEGVTLEAGDLVVTAGASALSHEAAIRILERGEGEGERENAGTGAGADEARP